jgi:hypothetical protein
MTHTGGSGGRGEADGEIWRVEVLGAFGNCSPEFRLAAARSSRGRNRRPGAQEVAKSCQRGWFGRGGSGRAEEDRKGVEAHQKSAALPSSSGGAAVSGSGSLAAMG